MKPVQSIERAFAVLEALASEPGGLSETARRVDLPKSTVARLMATLEAVGAVERLGDRYHLGPRMEGLAPRSIDLIALAQPHLEQLAADTDEDAGLSVLDGDRMHTIVQVDTDQTVQARDWTGELALIHSVPSGMTLLATWPEDRLERYLDGPLERSTPQTLIDADQIRARLAQIRKQGYAWGREEFHEGINSVAAAVTDASGAFVAAVHVHGPAYRFPKPGADDEIGRAIVEAADGLSRLHATLQSPS